MRHFYLNRVIPFVLLYDISAGKDDENKMETYNIKTPDPLE